MEANARQTSRHAIDGAALGLIAFLVILGFAWDVRHIAAIIVAAGLALIVWRLPSTTEPLLPSVACKPAVPANHAGQDDELQGWIRARNAQGCLDVPFRDLAARASADLKRRVGVEELCAALERWDARRVLAASRRRASR